MSIAQYLGGSIVFIDGIFRWISTLMVFLGPLRRIGDAADSLWAPWSYWNLWFLWLRRMDSILMTALDQYLVWVALLDLSNGTHQLLSRWPVLVGLTKVLKFLAAWLYTWASKSSRSWNVGAKIGLIRGHRRGTLHSLCNLVSLIIWCILDVKASIRWGKVGICVDWLGNSASITLVFDQINVAEDLLLLLQELVDH